MSEFFHAIDSGTWEKPEVFAIAQELSVSQGDAFLACVCMWDYFRRNSIDGTVSGVTPAVIDRQVRLPGFAVAAAKVNWLEVIDGGLRQPGFKYHLHGCESLKAFRHRNRAKKSGSKTDLIDALRDLDPEAAARAEGTTDDDAQESLREKRSQSKRKEKRENQTHTGPEDRAEPEVENSKALKRSPGEAPASIVFAELLRTLPLLQQLDAVPVAASGKEIFGSVISRDRLKPEEIERADSAYWLAWYRDQLGSKSPMLTGGTLAEATYVLASVFAAKRCRNVDNKLAVWIKWLKARECKSITESDWKRAAERMSKQISDPQPARPREPPAETPKPIDPPTALSIDDVQSGWLKERLQRKQKTG